MGSEYKMSTKIENVEEAKKEENVIEDSFIVYPSNFIAAFDEPETVGREITENMNVTESPMDVHVVEGATTLSEDLVTEEKLQDVMESNTKIVDILQNTLEMQAYLFDKFF